MAKSVLIIEDLDRIDSAHLFRIMNVLSSQVDNPYYSNGRAGKGILERGVLQDYLSL